MWSPRVGPRVWKLSKGTILVITFSRLANMTISLMWMMSLVSPKSFLSTTGITPWRLLSAIAKGKGSPRVTSSRFANSSSKILKTCPVEINNRKRRSWIWEAWSALPPPIWSNTTISRTLLPYSVRWNSSTSERRARSWMTKSSSISRGTLRIS